MKNKKYTLGSYQFYIVTVLFQKEKILQQKIVTRVTRNTVPTFRNLMRMKCKLILAPIIPEGLN